MSDKDTAQNVIESYRKRQESAKRAPLIIGIASLFLVVGAAFIIFWLLGPNQLPTISLFASATPTPTETPTPTATATNTSTATVTLTETATPTITLTPTASGPFIYQVEDGDSLWGIAERFNVDLLVLITINNLDPANPSINVGDKLTIPAPDTKLPTPTALPTDIRKGTKIEYQVQLGDSILSIATEFYSTVEAIKDENEIENENEIFVGQVLIIPVNLVTPVPTATLTATLSTQLPQFPTSTPNQ